MSENKVAVILSSDGNIENLEIYARIMKLKTVQLPLLTTSVVCFIYGCEMMQTEILEAVTYLTHGAFIMFNVLFLTNPNIWRYGNLIQNNIVGAIFLLGIGFSTAYSAFKIHEDVYHAAEEMHRNVMVNDIIRKISISSYLKGISAAISIIIGLILVAEIYLLNKFKYQRYSNPAKI